MLWWTLAQAATFDVCSAGCSHTTLADAMNAANGEVGPHTITLFEDATLTGSEDFQEPTTLEGGGYAIALETTGSNPLFMFQVLAPTTIRDAVITWDEARARGFRVYPGQSLVLEDVTAIGYPQLVTGGVGLFARLNDADSMVEVRNSTIQDFETSSAAAVFDMSMGGTVVVQDTVFSGIQAGSGAIANVGSGGSFTVLGGTMDDVGVGSTGGGIAYAQQSSVVRVDGVQASGLSGPAAAARAVSGSRIEVSGDASLASTSGRLFMIAGGELEVDGASLTSESANRGGVAEIISGADATFANATVSGSSSGGLGGAIYFAGGSLDIQGSEFRGNTSAVDGGAIYVSLGRVDIASTVFCDNTAADDGGAIHYQESGGVGDALTLTGVVFLENDAGSRGGAIFDWRTPLDIRHATFARNTAGSGADIQGGTSPDVDVFVYDSIFHDGGVESLIFDTAAVLELNTTLLSNTTYRGVVTETLPIVGSAGFTTPAGPCDLASVLAGNDAIDAASDGSDLGALDTSGGFLDVDADGVVDIADCAPADGAISPLQVEITCNGLDDDCSIATADSADVDADGFECPLDCDDSDPTVFPAAVETCNTVDDDCDGDVDEGVVVSAWPDVDGDGFGDPAGDALVGCGVPSGFADNDEDCDDGAFDVNPSIAEVCNGIDDDCNGQVDDGTGAVVFVDGDGDGFGDDPVAGCIPGPGQSATDGDCDDADPDRNPSADELCNGIDDDCDLDVDEGLATLEVFEDADGDGFGGESLLVCEVPSGFVEQGGDCDDADAAINPDAVEVSGNEVDEDCDGTASNTRIRTCGCASTASPTFAWSLLLRRR